MERCLITGLGATGKSALADRLGCLLGVEPIHLDDVVFGPGWSLVPKGEVQAQIGSILGRESWILDGGFPRLLPQIAAKADLVIWLDYSRWVVLRRAVFRTIRRLSRRASFGAKTEAPLDWLREPDHPVRVAVCSYRSWRKALGEAVVAAVGDRPILARIPRPRDLERLVVSLEP